MNDSKRETTTPWWQISCPGCRELARAAQRGTYPEWNPGRDVEWTAR